MEAFLKYLLESIVDNTKAVDIQREEDDQLITLTISADPLEYGKIIGKKGKTINAIRTLFNLYLFKSGDTQEKRINVRVAESPIEAQG